MKQNYDIRINPQRPSSEEIAKHKNFEALYQKLENKSAVKPAVGFSSGKYLKYIVGGSMALAASIALFLYIRNPYTTTDDSSRALALKQPFQNIQLPLAQYKVDAEKGDTLKHSSGSVIVIPATAFVDKNGKAVNGKVDIHYREYNNSVDKFLTGIPQSENNTTLQSAAMIQIQGFKDGKPVFISKDKELQLELKSTIPSSLPIESLTAYSFTNSDKDWVKGNAVKTEIIASDESSEEDSKNVKNSKKIDISPRNKFVSALEKKYPMPVKPIEPRKGLPKDMMALNLDVRTTEFPELAKYENVEWAAKKSIVEPLPEDGWSGIKVNKISDLKYEMVMIPNEAAKKEGRKEIRFEAFPLIPYSKKSYVEFEKDNLAYQEKLKIRNEKFEKELNKWLQSEGRFAEADKKEAGDKIRNIVCRFSVNKFGLWNTANPFDLKSIDSIQPEFVTASGDKITAKEIFVSDDKNHIYYSSSNSGALHFDTENKKAKVWIMDAEGLLFVSSGQTAEGNKVKFVLKPAETKSESDVRNAFVI